MLWRLSRKLCNLKHGIPPKPKGVGYPRTIFMKVAIYCRVSTDEQELKQQVNACIKFCEFKGFEIGKRYTDIGSGKDYFKREAFKEMLEALRRYEYEGIVVFRFDRLGRNMIQAVEFFEEMENKGIKIFSLNENIDTTTAMGRAIRDFIIRLAQLERENISEMTKQRLKAMKEDGIKLGRPVGSKDNRPRKNIGYLLRWTKKRNKWVSK